MHTNSGDVLKALTVADSTGHGIPASLLTLLCIGLLNASFTHHDVNSPAQAIDFVKARLVKLFSSEGKTPLYDGMDIAFCVFNPKNNTLTYAGANRSCIIINTNNELIEYKGDKQHVGYDGINTAV